MRSGRPPRRRGRSRDGQTEQPAVRLLGGERVVERSDGRERDGRPGSHRGEQRRDRKVRVPDERGRRARAELDGRRRGKDRGEEKTDRRRDDEARVRRVEEDARRRERVESEEPCAHEEGERDEEEPRIRPAPRGVARGDAERDVRESDREDEPEMGGVVFPLDVETRLGEQEPEPGERQDQQRGPYERWTRQRSALSSRRYSSRS